MRSRRKLLQPATTQLASLNVEQSDSKDKDKEHEKGSSGKVSPKVDLKEIPKIVTSDLWSDDPTVLSLAVKKLLNLTLSDTDDDPVALPPRRFSPSLVT